MSKIRVPRGARGVVMSLVDPELVGTWSGTATVDVVDDSGAGLASASVAHADEGYAFTLPNTVTSALGVIAVRWSISGVLVQEQQVDVVGQVLFTLAQARVQDLIPEESVSDEELREARSDAERDLEDACGAALARRRDRYTPIPIASPVARVDWHHDPVVVVTDNVDFLSATYEYGPFQSPARATLAALTLVKSRLLQGPIDTRALGIAVEGGGSIALSTPGVRGAIFGIPEVDAFVAAYRASNRFIG